MEASSRISRPAQPWLFGAILLVLALAFYCSAPVEAQPSSSSIGIASFVHPGPVAVFPFSFWKTVAGGTPTPTPQTQTFTYVSNGDTNGVFYWLGTNKGAQAWANPHTGGFLTIGSFDGGNAPALGFGTSVAQAVDRLATDDCGIGTNAAGNYWRVAFPAGASLKPNGIWIRSRPTGSGTASNIASYKIQGSNDLVVWTDIYTVSGLTYATEPEYKYNAFTAPGVSYRYIRLLHNGNVTGANQFFFLTDWELYGVYTW
jgi:E3 ubiquitin-protein ligase HECTD1